MKMLPVNRNTDQGCHQKPITVFVSGFGSARACRAVHSKARLRSCRLIQSLSTRQRAGIPATRRWSRPAVGWHNSRQPASFQRTILLPLPIRKKPAVRPYLTSTALSIASCRESTGIMVVIGRNISSFHRRCSAGRSTAIDGAQK